jgi:hypothetical protein
MEDMFNERMSPTTIVEFIVAFAREYRRTEGMLGARLMQSSCVHVDETRINIEGAEYYVWIFTDGEHVIFRMTETREATIVHELLSGYQGVLITDFYAGYDSVPCRQQKCWVHLIRDLNDDLWANPFNAEFERFVSDVRDLIIPIFEAVGKYGLKKRNLRKFKKPVERFYEKTIRDRIYESEVTCRYQKRFERYRESLFVFLDEDCIAWNNNTAERALRDLAVQRKISGSFLSVWQRIISCCWHRPILQISGQVVSEISSLQGERCGCFPRWQAEEDCDRRRTPGGGTASTTLNQKSPLCRRGMAGVRPRGGKQNNEIGRSLSPAFVGRRLAPISGSGHNAAIFYANVLHAMFVQRNWK